MPNRTSINTKTGKNELTSDEWLKVLKSIPKPAFVGFTGGEPLLHPGFRDIIRHVSGRLPFTVNTNGLLLDDDMLGELIECGVSNISISIDGFADLHDKSRKKLGLFDHIVKRIMKLNEIKGRKGIKKPTLTVKTVLLDGLSERLAEFYRFCNDVLKADCINISFMKTAEHAQFDFRTYESLSDLREVGVPQCYDYGDKDTIPAALGELLDMSLKNRCKVLLYPKMSSKASISKLMDAGGKNVFAPCYLPWSLVVVLSDGEIIPCLSVRSVNVRALEFDMKKLSGVERHRGFLMWRDKMNRERKSPQECNMCCFSEVNE